MAATKAFPKERIFEFISEIENRPYIWNFRLPNYHRKRHKEMEEIARLFEVTSNYLFEWWWLLNEWEKKSKEGGIIFIIIIITGG